MANDLASNKPSSVTLSIDTANPGPEINKNIYGQFAEHLGRLLYDGMWVGPESTIPNTRGWRNDVIEALKAIQVPVMRWPGGCFSDEYRWRDGIGPREERPVRVNSLWGGVEESNHVGTHEFFDLVEMIGAEAYVNCNMGTGSPREMAEWLEYLTSESKSELAELRRRNGRDAPFRVHHFGIGNETWGAGGFMRPEYYCDRYKHWSTMARVPWHLPTNFIASGGHGGDEQAVSSWTDYLTANIEPNFLLKFDGVAFHYYTHPNHMPGFLVFEDLGSCLNFPEKQWISTLEETLKMKDYLAENVAVLDKNDPEGHVGFYVDEWGTWYDPEEDANGMLFQQNSLRDAVVAGLNFHVFHDQCERVRMTSIAQVTNVLQAMILTEGEQMLLTPTYHAFRLYVPFQGAQRLPLNLEDVGTYDLEGHSVPKVTATAARSEAGDVIVGLVNTHPHQAQTVVLTLPEGAVSALKGEILTADEMDAHNTFEAPRSVEPQAFEAAGSDGTLCIELPPKALLVGTVT
ncbi:MAG: alpha-N-arabinofuranosidase [Halioglobus sp.]